MSRSVNVARSVMLVLLLAVCGSRTSWAVDGSPVAVGGSERLALVTFVDRSLKRAPTGGPGDTYTPAIAYESSRWSRRVAHELGRHHNLQAVSQWPVLTLSMHCVVYRIDDGRPLSVVMAELRKEKVVSGVYPMNAFHAMAADPYVPLQSAVADMQVEQAHRFSTGRDVTVAVVDTGIDIKHPDLSGQISSHRDLVNDNDDAILNEAHGTAVGGVIAARAGNAAGIVGVAPSARLAALRACWPSAPDALDATCNTLTLAKAIDTAIRLKVQILNLSLSGPRDALLETLLQVALAQGMLVVGSMSAAGTNDDTFPAAVAGVIRVGVAGQTADSATVMAPGTEVFTTMPHQRYGYISGSSIAAAHISGMIALLLEIAPTLSGAEIAALLANDKANSGALTRTINACSVLARASRGVECVAPSAVLGSDAQIQRIVVDPSRS